MRRQLSGAEIDAMVAMRERGMTYRAIAREFGVSFGAVYFRCLQAGAEAPKPSRVQTRRYPVVMRHGREVRAFTPDEDAELSRLRLDGLGLTAIARTLGRPRKSVEFRLLTLARRDERSGA